MYKNKKIFAIVMAGGKGTRIGAVDKPKVMFEVADKPIIEWAIRPFEKIKQEGILDRLICVVGFLGNQVVDYLGDRSEFVWQKEQLGTAHAVKMAEGLIADEEGYTIIVNGDHVLYSAETFKMMISDAVDKNLTLGFGVVESEDLFDDYGRVQRDDEGNVMAVIERPEATDEQRKINEKSINLYAVDNKWLFQTLPKIKESAVKKEYYIVDIVKLCIDEGKKIEAIKIKNLDEARGVNTLEDRDAVESLLKNS